MSGAVRVCALLLISQHQIEQQAFAPSGVAYRRFAARLTLWLLPPSRCDGQDAELLPHPVSGAEGADGRAFHRAGHTDLPQHVHQVTCMPSPVPP